MILFVLIIILEIIACMKRSTKHNLVRLITNLIGIAVSAITAILIAANVKIAEMADLVSELSEIEYFDQGMIDSVEVFANRTVVGLCATVLFVFLFLIIKGISGAITRGIFRKKEAAGTASLTGGESLTGSESLTGIEHVPSIDIDSTSTMSQEATAAARALEVPIEKPKFNVAGLIIGLVAGIIYAGFVIMPYTGFASLLDKEDVADVVELCEATDAELPDGFDKYLNIIFNGPATYAVKYTGIGYATDAVWDSIVGTGKAIRILVSAKDEAAVLLNEKSSVKDKLDSLSKLVKKLDKTHIFTEEQTVAFFNRIVDDLLYGGSGSGNGSGHGSGNGSGNGGSGNGTGGSGNGGSGSKIQYENTDDIVADLEVMGDIADKLEKAGIDLDAIASDNKVDVSNISLTKEDVNGIVDDIYSMSDKEGYVVTLMEQVFNVSDIQLEGGSLDNSREEVSATLNTALEAMQEYQEKGYITDANAEKYRQAFEDNSFISEESLNELMEKFGITR